MQILPNRDVYNALTTTSNATMLGRFTCTHNVF
uniref:Uncharacterized protein n=1 Tax=Arundo donax TaxID=35708 RepID=A0A0A9HGB5_ARUDO